jgi:hypothetical protein
VALRLLGRTQPRPIVVSLVPRVNSVGEGTSLSNGLARFRGLAALDSPSHGLGCRSTAPLIAALGFTLAGTYARPVALDVRQWSTAGPAVELPRTRRQEDFSTPAARLLSQYSTLGELPFPLLRSEPLTMLEPVRPIAVCRRTEPSDAPPGIRLEPCATELAGHNGAVTELDQRTPGRRPLFARRC